MHGETVKNNSVKYSQGINFSRSTLTEKTAIKNLGSATADLSRSHREADCRIV